MQKRRARVTKAVTVPEGKGGKKPPAGSLKFPLVLFPPKAVSSGPTVVRKKPPFVPPTNPPEFTVEQAVHLLAKRVVRAAWSKCEGFPNPDAISEERINLLERVQKAVDRLLGD